MQLYKFVPVADYYWADVRFIGVGPRAALAEADRIASAAEANDDTTAVSKATDDTTVSLVCA